MTILSAGPMDLEAGWENYADGTTPANDPSNFSYRVYAGTPDAGSSNVELYWDYVQGAQRANQFCLTITQGNTISAYRVVAVGTAGTQKHRVDIKQLSKSVAVSVTIAAEFVAKAGIIQKAPVSGWSFTPSSSTGSSPSATVVGYIDLAGGNVWNTTQQFRNNDVPSNDPSNFSYRVYAGTPDALSSNVELYWDYTQGTNRATQFSLTITDGTATYHYRVPAISAISGPYKHRVDIKQLKRSKAVTISIAAEYSGEGGIVFKNPVAGWSFTPNSDYGSSPSALTVGTLDWAGGNVWFDTEQYRNDYVPTNAASNFSLYETHGGGNQSFFSLTGLSTYTQGANIATHIAVFIREGGGSISLTTDAIVTLMNVASLPSTFVIPYPLAYNVRYTVGIVALALTLHGYSFNATVREIDHAAGGSVFIYNAGLLEIKNTGGDTEITTAASGGGDILLRAYTGKVIKIESDVTVSADKTIDGVDISVLDGAAAKINVANSLGASYKAIPGATGGRVGIRMGSSAGAPAYTDLDDGEIVFWLVTGAGTYHLIQRTGTSLKAVTLS